MITSPTFADVFILQPEPPLDLLVWVPDGAGLLKAVDRLLDVMVAKVVQQGHKIPTRRSPIEGVQSIVEGYGEKSRERRSEDSQAGVWPPRPLGSQCGHLVWPAASCRAGRDPQGSASI